MPGHAVVSALNAHLNDYPVRVTAAEPVAPYFHARFHAIKREYHYVITAGYEMKEYHSIIVFSACCH